jgi:hypothetical protein
VTATDTAGGGQIGEWPAAATSATGSATATPGTAGHEMLGRGGAAGAVARRAELTERAREFARGARADSTWAAYDGKWARFTAWCAEQEETPLPADPLTVVRFLTDARDAATSALVAAPQNAPCSATAVGGRPLR